MMHQRIPNIFHVSALAIAVLSTTGCAVTANPSDIGDSLVDAGRSTASASSRVLEGTKRLFGFDRNETQQQPELDEVDLALMDTEDTLMSGEADAVVATPVLTVAAAEMTTMELPNGTAPPVDAPAIATMPATDPNAIPVATVDYTHIVGPQETMWTIAKLTTGNPNNWRILAEINKMDLNSPIQIGQEVFIPADLVSPDLVSTIPVVKTLPLPAELAAEASGGDVVITEPLATANVDTSNIIVPAADEDNTLTLAAATPEPKAEPIKPARDLSLNALPLTADAGETLWDMAKRTTGDALNWKPIAEHNGFSERDIGLIRYGQTIYVPEELARVELGGKNKVIAKAKPKTDTDKAATDALASAKKAEPAKALKTAEATKAAAGENKDAVEASAALVASAGNLMDETQDIKIVEAKFQATEANTDLPTIKAENGAGADVITVSGTYYPKAVYNEADFSSSLLMRVSPGTQLTVSRSMGPWYEVQTEHGLGFMHSRDVK